MDDQMQCEWCGRFLDYDEEFFQVPNPLTVEADGLSTGELLYVCERCRDKLCSPASGLEE